MCGLLKRSWIQSWIWKCVLTENARLVYFVWRRGQQSFSIVAWTDSKTWQYNWKCSTECHSDSKCERSQSLAPLILRKSQSRSEGSCWRYLTNTSDAKHTPGFYLSFHPLIRFIRSRICSWSQMLCVRSKLNIQPWQDTSQGEPLLTSGAQVSRSDSQYTQFIMK